MDNVKLTLAQQLLLEDLIERAIKLDEIIRPMAGTRECAPGQVISRLLKLGAGTRAQRHSKYPPLEFEPGGELNDPRSHTITAEQFNEDNTLKENLDERD